MRAFAGSEGFSGISLASASREAAVADLCKQRVDSVVALMPLRPVPLRQGDRIVLQAHFNAHEPMKRQAIGYYNVDAPSGCQPSLGTA